MPHNILISGASGYLGGTLFARLQDANLPTNSYDTIYALVRSETQADAVKQYGAIPLTLDLNDEESVTQTIVDKGITIIFYLVNAIKGDQQRVLIRALGQVKKKIGADVHFLHTTGAKMFSSHVGFPTDQPLPDTDPRIYDLSKSCEGPFKIMIEASRVNAVVIDEAESYGVRSYVFAPCIVYGKGEGFGNKISIQDVAIVQTALELRRVYSVDSGSPTWPVCHVVDNATLYIQILEGILAEDNIGYGKNGFYLASSGSVAWIALYQKIASALKNRGVIDTDKVEEADESALAKMGKVLGCPPEFVPVQVGGTCTYTAQHGKQIGWKPQYAPEHILDTAQEEVDLILSELQEKKKL